MADRPLGVTILCILLWIEASIFIAFYALLVFVGIVTVQVVIIVFIIIAIIAFITTIGLWHLKLWAFWLILL